MRKGKKGIENNAYCIGKIICCPYLLKKKKLPCISLAHFRTCVN